MKQRKILAGFASVLVCGNEIRDSEISMVGLNSCSSSVVKNRDIAIFRKL